MVQAWTISRTTRGKQPASQLKEQSSPQRNSNSPGPGGYEHQKADKVVKDKTPEWTFGKKGPHRQQEGSPGPGQYETPAKSGNKFTIGSRSSGVKNPLSPGPGTYNADRSTNKMNQSRSQIGFGSTKKGSSVHGHSKSALSPAPGQYEYDYTKVKPKNPVYGFGKTSRQIKEQSNNIDYYSPGKAFGEGAPKVSMNGRPSTAKVRNEPGPGSYGNDFKTIGSMKTAGGKISQVPKSSTKQNNGLGPGQYDILDSATKCKSPQISFSKTNRGANTRDVSPGPGVYEAKSSMGGGGPSFSMKSTKAKDYMSPNPGPGQYEGNDGIVRCRPQTAYISSKSKRGLEVSKQDMEKPGPGMYSATNSFGAAAPKFTIGSKRDLNLRDGSPGPANYSPNSSPTKCRSPEAYISKSNRKGMQSSNSPGPGAYEGKHTSTTPSYTMGNKRQDKQDFRSPGPGTYEEKTSYVKDRVRDTKFGNTNRSNIVGNDSASKPGPGQYDNNSPSRKFGKSGVCFTIGGKSPERRNDYSPGPGQYHEEAKKSNQVHAFSKQGRSDIVSKNAKESPGPGNYYEEKQFGKDARSFQISGKAQDRVRDDKPGPGHYQDRDSLTKCKSQAAFIAKTSRADVVSKERSSSPGPGMYYSPTRNGGPSHAFGNKTSPIKQADNPGPGNYNANESAVKDRTISYSIGKQGGRTSHAKSYSEAPAPGNYDSPSKIGQGQKFKIGEKRESRSRDFSPGPCAYNANNSPTKDRVVSHKIGSTSRTNIVSNEQSSKPGPGHYEQKSMKSQFSATILGKAADRNRNDSPGPGHYNEEFRSTKDRVISFKMSPSKRGDIVSSEQKSKPGPGQYESSPLRSKFSATITGRPADNQRNDSPGPGTYREENSAVKDRVVSYKMSPSKRSDIVSPEVTSRPGPGMYEVQSQKSKRSAKITGKPVDKVGNDVPGPGSFNANYSAVKDKVVSHKMSNTKKSDMVGKETKSKPGPGAYEASPTKNTRAARITGRPADHQRNDAPGPGQYSDDQKAIRDKSPSYRMSPSKRGDIVSKEFSERPGPGTYDGDKLRKTQSAMITGKPADNRRNDSPGPGHYKEEFTVVKDKVVSFRMSPTKRGDIVSKEFSDRPGPGTYDGDKLRKTQSAMITGKPSDNRRNDSPGPGHYNEEFNVVKDKVVSHKMSPSKRGNIVSQEASSSPAPGSYTVDVPKSKRAALITGKPQDNQRSDAPGPGHYNEEFNVVKDKVPSYRMSPVRRGDIVSKEFSERPGPGTYDGEKQRKIQSATITGKPSDNRRNDSPGPGHYNEECNVVKDKVVSHKMSPSKRGNIVSQEASSSPAPGSYTVDVPKSKRAALITGKPQDNQRSDAPGPGHYNEEFNVVKDKVVSYKMSPTRRSEIVNRDSSSSPAPGSYNVDNQKSKRAALITGKPQDNQRNDSPGPGHYNEEPNNVKAKNPSYRMSPTKRGGIVSKEQSSQPAPGSYTVEVPKNKRAARITGRPKEKMKRDAPGPGTYNGNANAVKDKVTSHKISPTKRKGLVSKDQKGQPGPGNYANESTFGTGPKFTIGSRKQDERPNNAPGPGSYEDTFQKVKDRTPAYQISKSGTGSPERYGGSREGSPGPGHYDQNSRLGGQSATITGRPDDRNRNDSPGPGQYEGSLSAVKDRVPAYKMSPSKRGDFVSPDSRPGPGMYDGEVQRSHFAATITGKPSDKTRNDSPGPGAYNGNESITKPRNPSVSFSKQGYLDPRDAVDNRDYDSRYGHGQSHSFGRGEQHNSGDANLGPGYYKIPCTFADVPRYVLPEQNEEFKWV